MASLRTVAKLRRRPVHHIRCWTPSRTVVTKTTTGIVGLNVDPNGRTNLIAVYEKILRELQAIPEDAAYRRAVEAIATYRIKTAQALEDEVAIEEEIGMGQLEELIECVCCTIILRHVLSRQANDELECIKDYKEAKMWEVIKELNPEIRIGTDKSDTESNTKS